MAVRKWKDLIDRFLQPSASRAEEDFIRVIQLLDQDPSFKANVLKIISLDSFNRHSMIGALIQDLSLKGAPRNHLNVIRLLADDRICEKILAMYHRNE